MTLKARVKAYVVKTLVNAALKYQWRCCKAFVVILSFIQRSKSWLEEPPPLLSSAAQLAGGELDPVCTEFSLTFTCGHTRGPRAVEHYRITVRI